jgi:hypothetical protein
VHIVTPVSSNNTISLGIEKAKKTPAVGPRVSKLDSYYMGTIHLA